MHLVIHNDADVEPWKGCRDYRKGARCTHNGKTWECDISSIYNPAFEPGGFAPYGWKEVDQPST